MPEELVVFDETSAEFFADPKAALAAGREEAVGFGLELGLLTPFVLSVAGAAVQFLVTTVSEAAKEEAGTVLRRLLARVLNRRPGPDTGKEPVDAESASKAMKLSDDDARRLQEVTLRQALAVGLPHEQAALVADAVIGRLLLPG